MSEQNNLYPNGISQSELLSKLEKQAKEAATLLLLLEKFPDLKEIQDRWGKVRYSSASINSKVTDCEIKRTCGCCSECGLLVLPFVNIDGFRIYSYPESFLIGDHQYGDDIPRPDWKDQLTKANIPDIIINIVQVWFSVHAPEPEDAV